MIAEHRRIWDKERVALQPAHYLALLEKRPGALDYALPLADWNLPECFEILRRRMENQWERGKGTKEYIRILRPLEKRALCELTRAVEKTVRTGGITRDVVAQYLYGDEKLIIPRFNLDGRDHLKPVQVDPPDLRAYQAMLEGASS